MDRGRRTVELSGYGRAVVFGTIVEEREFVILAGRDYPDIMPKVWARGWEPTKALCSHHFYEDSGRICYGHPRDEAMKPENITLATVIRHLDSYVVGMVQWRIEGEWRYEWSNTDGKAVVKSSRT